MNNQPISHRGRRLLLGAVLAALVLSQSAQAQSLIFVYVEPTANALAHFARGDVQGVQTDGYRGVVIDGTTEGAFRANAPADLVKMFDALQPGQLLRTRIDAVRQISAGKVDVELYLVDDRTRLAKPSQRFSTQENSGQWIVWPATFLFKSQASGRWTGRVGVGQLAIDALEASLPGKWTGVEAVFLHEFSHSQMIETEPFGEFSKWGTWKGRPDQWITYGQDGKHQSQEILGDQSAALDEGLGNFFFHIHDPAAHQPMVDFFRDTKRRYTLEPISVMAGSADLSNAPRKLEKLANGAEFWTYKWRDVPGWYLLFTESTSTGFFHFFWQNANDDKEKALEWVMSAASAMHETRLKRYLTYAVNRLSLDMEAYALTPDGQAEKVSGTLVSSLFPFALLDILTDFDMSEAQYKADYGRNHPDLDPQAFSTYWSQRAGIEAVARPHLKANPIEIEEAIEAVRNHLRGVS